jgi:Tc5 transposase DNA-binding domain
MRKRSQKNEGQDERIEATLEDLRKKKFKYLSVAAKAHGIPEATLRGRKNGRKSRAEANEPRQALSKGEEKALIQWILNVSKSGYPPSKALVRSMAEHIRRQRVSQINHVSIILVEYPLLGGEWIDCFIQRHKTLCTMYARQIDASRVRETTANSLLQWLNTV